MHLTGIAGHLRVTNELLSIVDLQGSDVSIMQKSLFLNL